MLFAKYTRTCTTGQSSMKASNKKYVLSKNKSFNLLLIKNISITSDRNQKVFWRNLHFLLLLTAPIYQGSPQRMFSIIRIEDLVVFYAGCPS